MKRGWVVATVTALVLLGAACDWLWSFDKVAPTCRITSPPDSGTVSGDEMIQANAYDSVGVDYVNFYVDGALLSTDSFSPYEAAWSTSGLVEESWHALYCEAFDLADNKGVSETVNVQVVSGGQTSIVHGQFDISSGFFLSFGFLAETGDTLAGDALVTYGGQLTSFLWLDRAGYAAFRGNGSYAPLYRQDSFTSFSMTQGVASSDSFYLVFRNQGSGMRTVWARFVVE